MPDENKNTSNTTSPKRRGFASMDPEKQREIASKGGRAAHEKGSAHQFTSEEASAAGRRGGEIVSRDREFMARIGRKGGHALHKPRNTQKAVAEETPQVEEESKV